MSIVMRRVNREMGLDLFKGFYTVDTQVSVNSDASPDYTPSLYFPSTGDINKKNNTQLQIELFLPNYHNNNYWYNNSTFNEDRMPIQRAGSFKIEYSEDNGTTWINCGESGNYLGGYRRHNLNKDPMILPSPYRNTILLTTLSTTTIRFRISLYSKRTIVTRYQWFTGTNLGTFVDTSGIAIQVPYIQAGYNDQPGQGTVANQIKRFTANLIVTEIKPT